MADSIHVRAHLFISGRVQGVGFRAHTQREAERLGITGWVRNMPDGRVELVAEGETTQIDQLVDWCRSGPARAMVADVRVEREAPVGEPAFSIRYG